MCFFLFKSLLPTFTNFNSWIQIQIKLVGVINFEDFSKFS